MAKKLFLVMMLALTSIAAGACGDDAAVITDGGTPTDAKPDSTVTDGGDAGHG